MKSIRDLQIIRLNDRNRLWVGIAATALVAGLGGSISAEHGIGVAKRRFLHLARSPEEIAAFRAVKAALDPDGILNPGVLL